MVYMAVVLQIQVVVLHILEEAPCQLVEAFVGKLGVLDMALVVEGHFVVEDNLSVAVLIITKQIALKKMK